MKKVLIAVVAFAIMAAVLTVIGLALAWLFAQFGVVKPWYVFSVAWVFAGLLSYMFRTGAK